MTLFLILSIAFSKCAKIKYRKSVFDMSDEEITRWQKSHVALYQSGILSQMTKIHGTYQTIHQDNHIWGWHREFTNWYEEELIKIDPQVILPYYPWIYDAEAPELSSVWDDSILGGSQLSWNGNSFDPVCIPSGPFVGLVDNEGQCVKRQFDRQGHTGFPQDLLYKIGRGPTDPVALKIQLYGESSFEQWIAAATPEYFVSLLNTPHFLVHLFVGGSQSWFKTSCFDGLFWLHHGFMDYILDIWLKAHPDQIQNWPEAGWKLDHFGMTTMEVLEKDYCVEYIPPSKKGSLNSQQYNTTNRVIPNIPQSPRISDMGMNPEYVRKSYNENKKIIVVTDIKKKYSTGSPSFTKNRKIPGVDAIIDGLLNTFNIKLSATDVSLIKNVVGDAQNLQSLTSMVKDIINAFQNTNSSTYTPPAKNTSYSTEPEFKNGIYPTSDSSSYNFIMLSLIFAYLL
eukprot:NODE_39_length_35218_cov_0.479655.p3 type:complete len:453 gc:universal NODE_39_length_35218_cov_0.479655:34170-32812(-)